HEAREFIAALGGAATWPLAARGQQPGKLPTIGFLGADASAFAPWTAAFVARMRELGWIEGQTVAIEYRWSQGRSARYRFSSNRRVERRRLRCARRGRRGRSDLPSRGSLPPPVCVQHRLPRRSGPPFKWRPRTTLWPDPTSQGDGAVRNTAGWPAN